MISRNEQWHEIDELLARSSLGTHGADAVGDRVSEEAAAEVLQRRAIEELLASLDPAPERVTPGQIPTTLDPINYFFLALGSDEGTSELGQIVADDSAAGRW